jgi:hypothetical protein
MDAYEIQEHKMDGATSVFLFARTYGDDRSSARASVRRVKDQRQGQHEPFPCQCTR